MQIIVSGSDGLQSGSNQLHCESDHPSRELLAWILCFMGFYLNYSSESFVGARFNRRRHEDFKMRFQCTVVECTF